LKTTSLIVKEAAGKIALAPFVLRDGVEAGMKKYDQV